jgi:hypothetical protein
MGEAFEIPIGPSLPGPRRYVLPQGTEHRTQRVILTIHDMAIFYPTNNFEMTFTTVLYRPKFKSISGRRSALRADRRPVHRLDPFLPNDIDIKCFVDILMIRSIRSPYGKTSLWTAAQGKNRPHLLPGDHASDPRNGDEGEMLHFLGCRETTHSWAYLPFTALSSLISVRCTTSYGRINFIRNCDPRPTL